MLEELAGGGKVLKRRKARYFGTSLSMFYIKSMYQYIASNSLREGSI